MISCICIATGRIGQLNESVAAFLAQTHEDKELIIVNCYVRQKLSTNIERVRVFNLTKQATAIQARNFAITNALGDVIVIWPEDDIVLPNHLTMIAENIEGKFWVWPEKEFLLDRGRLQVQQSGSTAFAFTKEVWLKAGKYALGVIDASDRNFVGRITKSFNGQKIPLNSTRITYLRCGTEIQKHSLKGMPPGGAITLQPAFLKDYMGIVKSFLADQVARKICVVELGRYGDIINILPFFQLIHDNYAKPDIAIAKEFASLFDGISYATPISLNLKHEELGMAMTMIKRDYPIVIRTQIWGKGHTQRQETEAYNVESWREAGLLHRFTDKTLRPFFDRRNPEREQKLLDAIQPDGGKPWLLVNFSNSQSSPCPACRSLLTELEREWGARFHIVDLAKIRAERIYDLLAVFERAVVLVSIDTSYLHLAVATDIPIVALVNPKFWAGTVPRMNCIVRLNYDEAVRNDGQIHNAIKKAIVSLPETRSRLNYVLQKPVERRIFHVTERHDEADPKSIERKQPAWDSWDACYVSGAMIPAHYWNYKRTASKEIGDKRALPFLKDMLAFTLEQMEDDDILCWTNDDNAIHPRLPEYLKFHVPVYGACTSLRSEFRLKYPPLELDPEAFDKNTMEHIGRDMLAATKSWFKKNWDAIPDFCLGASDFDLMLAAMIRLEYGIETTLDNIGKQIFPAEIPRGYIGHLFHHNFWSQPKNVDVAPSQKRNRQFWREWAAKNLPNLKFNNNNSLLLK